MDEREYGRRGFGGGRFSVEDDDRFEDDMRDWRRDDDRYERGRSGSRQRDLGRRDDERFGRGWDDDERSFGGGAGRGRITYGRFSGIGAGGRYSGSFVSYRGLGPRDYRRSDDRIREDVCESLTDHDGVDARNLDVKVEDGVVTLDGSVDDRRQKRLAEDAIEDLPGVRDVQNRIRVEGGMNDDLSRRVSEHRGGAISGDIWSPRDERWRNADLRGFDVEAPDGGIGKIDDRTEPGTGLLVVDTGPWIFGRHVLLPLGLVHRIDPDSQTVFVDRSKDEIRDAPEFSPDEGVSEGLRRDVGEYYASRARGHEPLREHERARF